jgi:hypothetical protein
MLGSVCTTTHILYCTLAYQQLERSSNAEQDSGANGDVIVYHACRRISRATKPGRRLFLRSAPPVNYERAGRRRRSRRALLCFGASDGLIDACCGPSLWRDLERGSVETGAMSWCPEIRNIYQKEIFLSSKFTVGALRACLCLAVRKRIEDGTKLDFFVNSELIVQKFYSSG